MSERPGKKAELDKDGIYLEKDKAELDKDGISLKDSEGELDSETSETDLKASKDSIEEAPKRSVIFIFMLIPLILLLGVGGILLYMMTDRTEQNITYTSIDTIAPQGAYSSEGDIILDPFIILYRSQNPYESGVLLAQVSLQVHPETAANIESNIFGVRSRILEKLSTNAEVYSKNELADMIRQDLRDLNVKDVAFIQYESR